MHTPTNPLRALGLCLVAVVAPGAATVAASVAAAIAPPALEAQGPRPIVLALPDAFPALDARIVLLRERGRDVLVLDPRSATSETLGVGLMLIRRLRRQAPPAGTIQLVPVTGFAMTRAWSPGQRARLENALGRLRARPTSRLGDLGTGRWIRWGGPR